jgi:hypothetical protein
LNNIIIVSIIRKVSEIMIVMKITPQYTKTCSVVVYFLLGLGAASLGNWLPTFREQDIVLKGQKRTDQ